MTRMDCRWNCMSSEMRRQKMDTTQEQTETQYQSFQEGHPWLEVDGAVDEDLRFTLDEIRFA